jgi:hypothetical protein
MAEKYENFPENGRRSTAGRGTTCWQPRGNQQRHTAAPRRVATGAGDGSDGPMHFDSLRFAPHVRGPGNNSLGVLTRNTTCWRDAPPFVAI